MRSPSPPPRAVDFLHDETFDELYKMAEILVSERDAALRRQQFETPPPSPRRRVRGPRSMCGSYFFTGLQSKRALQAVAPSTPQYVCTWTGCEASYSRSNDLERHVMRLHTKEKPFACTGFVTCAQSFVTKYDLDRHVRRTHTKECPYRCTWAGCGRTFVTQWQRSRHSDGCGLSVKT